MNMKKTCFYLTTLVLTYFILLSLIFKQKKDDPYPMLFSPQLWGDLKPTKKIIANTNRTQEVKQPQNINYLVRINNMGFRGDDLAPSEKNNWKALLLGDGYAFGAGLDQGEDIASQLIKKLLKNYPQTKLSVLNGGFGGYTITDEISYLKEKGHLFKPNLTIIIVASNDKWEIKRPISIRTMHKLSHTTNFYFLKAMYLRKKFQLYKFKNFYLKKNNHQEKTILNHIIPEYIQLANSLKNEVAKWKGQALFVLSNTDNKDFIQAMTKQNLNTIILNPPINIPIFLPDGHWTARMSNFVATKINIWIKEKQLIKL